MSERRIGVYVCHCGGNISDYVDVPSVVNQISDSDEVVVAREAMFTCSDATQQEIVDDIREQNLDGLVVASCSPKLHTITFRNVAQRAGLNPYQYTQVNVREQCSWAHTDDKTGATRKAVRLVRAGINRTALTTPLDPAVIDTLPTGLVIGGGVAGLRAALGLADVGLHAYLVERSGALGGWVADQGRMFPHDRDGHALAAELERAVRARSDITVLTGAEVVSKSGSFGNYRVGIRVTGQGDRPENLEVEVGSIIVATGIDTYSPTDGEYGYGIDGVVTLPEFQRMLADGPLTRDGRTVRDIAYVYCVGSRTEGTGESTGPHRSNPDCSRYCCTAALNAALSVSGSAAANGAVSDPAAANGALSDPAAANGALSDPAAANGALSDPAAANGATRIRQYHLYRDMRAYGKYELLYGRARAEGSVFVKVPDGEPPEVERDTASGRLTVTTKDALAGGEQITLPVDLVVLVTGMVPRENDSLVQTLKLPVGADGFLHEIHPKLRPVETVVDGVYICGGCQSPKTSVESVTSALAAVTQSAAILKRGSAELDPMVAEVRADACTWCGTCADACPYDAVLKVTAESGTGEVASIDPAGCKGCGGCVPVCPTDAIDLQGYTDAQVIAMIDGMLKEPVS